MFGSVQRAWEHGRGGRRRDDLLRLARRADRQLVEVAQAFEEAHRLGMFTVLWCYLRNSQLQASTAPTTALAADLTGQANHLGVTIQADIIKQKLPENNGGYGALSALNGGYGKTSKLVYEKLTTDNPIDLTR